MPIAVQRGATAVCKRRIPHAPPLAAHAAFNFTLAPHVAENLADSRALHSDQLHDMQLAARVKDSSLRFRHCGCPGGFHLQVCTKLLDQAEASGLGAGTLATCQA